jgi:tetratricopeptide (TPR) repeat protein
VELDHRQLGVDLYNGVWRLLEQERTPEQDLELVHQAHASAYHWLKAPECEPKNRARSEWLCSRVYAVLGRPEPALHHAEHCLQIVQADLPDMDDFDLPFAYEALARANAAAGNSDDAMRYEHEAREAAERITDAEDKDLVLTDLATL